MATPMSLVCPQCGASESDAGRPFTPGRFAQHQLKKHGSIQQPASGPVLTDGQDIIDVTNDLIHFVRYDINRPYPEVCKLLERADEILEPYRQKVFRVDPRPLVGEQEVL